MENKTIFVVTVFEKCDAATGRDVDIGDERSPCFKHTFKEAEEVVINNIGDIWETCYDYAVIEEIDCRIYPRYRKRQFYKYNNNIDGYEYIEEPECLKRMPICGIG